MPHEYIDVDVEDRFQVGRRIGRGCYGVVFEAIERDEERKEVAIKKVVYAFRDAVDAQRTYREVMYLLQFRGHANIVEIFYVVAAKDDKHLYLVTELLDSDLQRTIRTCKLEPVQRRFIVYQMLRGLKYIHSAGVVHRDLKPANVLINKNCQVKLADFGNMRSFVENVVSLDDLQFTDYIGSRWYRCPEMLTGAGLYSSAVDIWAVGCITGELRNRQPLFGGSSTVTMMEAIIDTLGKPTDFDIASLEGMYARLMLESLPVGPPRMPIERRFECEPHEVGHAEFVDFMKLMLQVNPMKRLTAVEALEHPHVADFHTPSDEPVFGRRIALKLPDDRRETPMRYRDQIYADVLGFARARQAIDDLRRQQLQDDAYLHRNLVV